MSATQTIKDRLLAGEALTVDVAEELGVSGSTFNLAIKGLKEAGHTVNQEPGEGNKFIYRVVGASNGNGNGKSASAPVKRSKEKLPDLGSTLTVVSLMLDGDGNKIVGLQDGSTMFFMQSATKP